MPPDTPDWHRELYVAYPPLALLADSHADAVLLEASLIEASAGDVLFEPNDFALYYPLILEGVARVLKVSATVPDTLLYRLRAGEHCLLSASGLLARWRFGARVIAETDARLVLIPGAIFRQLVQESTDFAHSVHLAIARRLEIVMDLVEQATYFRLDQRVASLILACGSPVSRSHQELADDLGVSRENVSLVLGEFRARGWVSLSRRHIEIVDAPALRSFLDGTLGARDLHD